MVALYLDHNISLHLVSPLQSAGHDVASARQLGLTRLSDDGQLLSAVRSARILVTHNRRDFLLLPEAWVTWPAAVGTAFPPHPGILVLAVAPDHMLAAAVSDLLGAIPSEELTNRLWWWQRPAGWFRRIAGVGWDGQ